MRLTEFVCYPVVTIVRLGMIGRMLAEVRQDANFTIKERGPRMAQIEKLTIERIEQPNDVLKDAGRRQRRGDEDHSFGAAEQQRADCRRYHVAGRGRKLVGGPDIFPVSN